MPLVPAKCPECGGLVEVDNEKRAGLCQHCGQPFVIEDAIQTFNTYYQTTNNYNTTHNYGDGAVINVYENKNSISALMERAFLFLEDGDFVQATDYFDKVLDIEPGHAEAYLGKLMAELRIRKQDELKNCACPFDNNNNYQKVLRFSDSSLKEKLISYIDFINTRNEDQRLEHERQAELSRREAEQKRIEAINFHKQKIQQCSSYSARISTGYGNTIGIKYDGHLIAVGDKANLGKIKTWKDIVAVSVGNCNTIGLKSNGTVVSVGNNYNGQCDVRDWTDIIAVSAGHLHTVGLKSNGTVIVTKYKKHLSDIVFDGFKPYNYGQFNIENWMNIVAIAAGFKYTVGLISDGTVVATGDNEHGCCNVKNWTDIIGVSAGLLHTVGLKSNGTVVAVGDNRNGQCDVSKFTDIVAISAGRTHTVGLKSDGTVVAVGNNRDGQCDVSDWVDIVAIFAGDVHTVGLKSDGTVVATKYKGENYSGACDVENWKLF